MIALAMSRRSGPSGEFHITPKPTEARTALVSARQTPGLSTARCGIDLQRAAPHWLVDLLGTGAGTEQRAGIGEDGAAHAEIVGNERERETHLRRRRPEGIAAERVAGQRVARTETRPVEAADGLAALVEEVEQAHVLAAPARDVAADRATDECDLLRDRIVERALAAGATVLDVAAEAGKLGCRPAGSSRWSGSWDGCAHRRTGWCRREDVQVLACSLLDRPRRRRCTSAISLLESV